MDSLDPNIRNGILFFIILASSLCVHEWAHAWVADRLGDPTPRADGRVTLNPIPHIDLVGTILFPLFCIFILKGEFFLGWAKPVISDSSYFKHPARGDLITTAAGPLSNLAITLLAAVVGGLLAGAFPVTRDLVGMIILVNAWLFVFNMLPLPPLDGGRILRHFVGMSWDTFAQISRWSMLVLIAAFYLVPRFRAVLHFLIGLAAEPAVILYRLCGG